MQWNWSFRLPGADGKLGSSDVRYIDSDNPLGVSPADPQEHGRHHHHQWRAASSDRQAREGAAALADVLHDFYIPEIRAKMDLVPGTVSYLWFTPTKTGEYDILCAAYCGIGHPQMRGKLIVDTQADYDKWLGSQQTFLDLRKAKGASRIRRGIHRNSRRREAHASFARGDDGEGRRSRMTDATLSDATVAGDHGVPPAEVPELDLYHPHTWLGKYVFSQDAKYIAIQYGGTATAVGLLGLVMSWVIRLQLAFPGHSLARRQSLLSGRDDARHDHGGLYADRHVSRRLWQLPHPPMVGARDMVFPFVNMLSYWVFLLAVIVLLASYFVPGGPTGAGWTLYPPQSIMTGTPARLGHHPDAHLAALFIVGFTMGGLNYVVTVLQARTRGMTLMRMPLTVWGIFAAAVMALLAFPGLFVACVMLLLDRTLGTSFFMPAIVELGEQKNLCGGSPILFQHLFWFFGHPEVYIVALPAFGIVSDLISVACPQEHLRLSDDGLGDYRDRRAEHGGLGPSHVCERMNRSSGSSSPSRRSPSPCRRRSRCTTGS